MTRKMSRAMRQEAEKHLRAENKKQSDVLTPIPREVWPDRVTSRRTPPIAVWRSKKYLVQEFQESSGKRLSICRAALLNSGDWDDGLTWDELIQIKREVGYRECWAYECYPPDGEIVNVANMRHLWIPDDLPDFGWYRYA